MQTLIEYGALAIAGWLLANVLVLIGWCWSGSRRRRRISHEHRTNTILHMRRNLSHRHLTRPFASKVS